jgi:hypothetical protein
MMWHRQQQDVITIINFYTKASPRKRSPTLISLISLFNEDYKKQDEDGSIENWVCNMRHGNMLTMLS